MLSKIISCESEGGGFDDDDDDDGDDDDDEEEDNKGLQSQLEELSKIFSCESAC